MELALFILLNVIAVIATAMFLAIRSLPEKGSKATDEDSEGWPGLEFVFVIIALVFWLCCMITVINLEVTYVYSNGADYYTYLHTLPNTWPFALIYALISIPEFLLVIFLWPEAWKFKGE